MLKQRAFQVACGYEDANDAETLRQDPSGDSIGNPGS